MPTLPQQTWTPPVQLPGLGGMTQDQSLQRQKDLLAKQNLPAAPKGTSMKDLRNQQIQYARDFRSSLPDLQSQMAGQLTRDTGQQLQGGLRGLKEADSARGLLYGGVHQGGEANMRAQSQRGLMGGISSINQGLQTAADQMDNAAVQTGLNIQSQAQALQNMVYQNAMARQAGQNQVVSSVASAGIMAALI